jgi:hypothetical protein
LNTATISVLASSVNRDSASMNGRVGGLGTASKYVPSPLGGDHRFAGQRSNGKPPKSGIISAADKISPNLRGMASGADESRSQATIANPID